MSAVHSGSPAPMPANQHPAATAAGLVRRWEDCLAPHELPRWAEEAALTLRALVARRIASTEETHGNAVGRVDADGRVTWYDPIPEGGALLYARPAGFPECSGCPDSCPENEGYGCCREEMAAPGAAAAAPDHEVYLAATEPQSMPAGWVPLTIEWEAGYPEEVAFGPKRMMDRLGKWLDRHLRHLISESIATDWKPIMVACSRGQASVGHGAVWHTALDPKTEWTVLRPTGDTIYSPSGLGGTPNFLCEAPDGRRDIFCGDSIAACLMERAARAAQAQGGA